MDKSTLVTVLTVISYLLELREMQMFFLLLLLLFWVLVMSMFVFMFFSSASRPSPFMALLHELPTHREKDICVGVRVCVGVRARACEWIQCTWRERDTHTHLLCSISLLDASLERFGHSRAKLVHLIWVFQHVLLLSAILLVCAVAWFHCRTYGCGCWHDAHIHHHLTILSYVFQVLELVPAQFPPLILSALLGTLTDLFLYLSILILTDQ